LESWSVSRGRRKLEFVFATKTTAEEAMQKEGANGANAIESGLRREEKFPCGNFGTKVERRRRSRVVYCWKEMVPEAGVEPARF